MAALIVTAGPTSGARHPIDKPVCTIGRGGGADINIADKRASRMHARIRAERDRHVLDDLQGHVERGGGTYVNDKPVTSHVLQANDLIRIAGVTFRFEADADAEPPAEITERTEIPQRVLQGRGPAKDLPIRDHVDATDTRASIIGFFPNLAKPDLSPAHERLLIVYEIANTISTHLDQTELINEILAALLRAFKQAAHAAMLSYDKATNTLSPRAERTRKGMEKVVRFPLSPRVVKRVVAEKQALIFGGIDAAPGSIAGMLSNSMLCAPLVARDEVLGAIHITSKDLISTFVRADLDLLVGISTQAAIALKNADMHAQLVARERLRYDLEVAQEIQRRFLPLAPPCIPGWAFAGEYKPALAIGGDFYDFIPLGPGRLAVLIGDVSGKGVSGALLMARVTSEFRMLAVTGRAPPEVMAAVNASLLAASYEGLFVTATYAEVDLRDGTVVFCNAGHLRPVVRRFGPEGILDRFDTADVPLGVIDDTVFTQASFTLGQGDIVLLMSDGVVESTNAKNRQLGLEPVEQVMSDGSGDAEATIQDVIGLVGAFVGGAPQFDDLTIVCFGREMPAVRELSDELEPL